MKTVNVQVTDLNRLSFLLGIAYKKLQHVANNIDDYYYTEKHPKTDDNGQPRMKNGKPIYRTLHPSTGLLKYIQKRIKKVLLRKITYPQNIQGGVKGKSNITNADLHKGKKYFLCTDLSKYYPSVSHKLVYNAFQENGFSHDVSRLLTRLTTYKYRLPQGTPTSPYLANLVFSKHDEKLICKCRETNLTYSRYVDDIAISSKFDFQNKITSLLKTIHTSPFNINHRKTFYKVGPSIITGIITKNNELDVREDQIIKLTSESLNEEQIRGLKEYITQVRSR